MPPTSQTVAVGSDVTLHCNATTDQLEERKLKITWLLNGEKIEFGSRTNVAQYDRDKSLRITQAQLTNTGNYTCNASNELDWDAETVRLTVQGMNIHQFSVHINRSMISVVTDHFLVHVEQLVSSVCLSVCLSSIQMNFLRK